MSASRKTARCCYHDHIVVCSLNIQGQAFIRNVRIADPDQPIVALLRHSENGYERWCKQQGVMLIYGDATQENALHTAAIANAKAIIACSESTDTNLQIARAVQASSLERPTDSEPLALYLAVSDVILNPGLGNENTPYVLQANERLNPCPYNADNLLARWYFNQYPPHIWADRHGQRQVHLVFTGCDPLVEALICQYARISPYKDFAPPIFTLLGEGAEKYREWLVARYPVFANGRTGAEQVIAGLYAVECSPAFTPDKKQLAEITDTGAVTAALFCSRDDETNYRYAMSLHQQTVQSGCWQVPFYVRLQDSVAIHTLLAATKSVAADLPFTPFGMAEQVFDLNRLMQVERNARAVHEAYRQTQEEAGKDVTTDSLQHWENLAETYRAANRRSGDHLPVKLASIGIPIEAGQPVLLDDAMRFDEPAERRELLSRLEHRSWRYERLLNGWRYGEQRNNQQRTHPSMVLWKDLPESERKKDIDQLQATLQIIQQHKTGK